MAPQITTTNFTSTPPRLVWYLFKMFTMLADFEPFLDFFCRSYGAVVFNPFVYGFCVLYAVPPEFFNIPAAIHFAYQTTIYCIFRNL